MVVPPQWDQQELEIQQRRAVDLFRRERLDEPVEAYSCALGDSQASVAQLLAQTGDLRSLGHDELARILVDKEKLEAFRYLAGPPVSEDDLRVLAEARSLAPSRLRNDPEAMQRIAQVVLSCLDARRFPWFSERRQPTEAERNAATLASACLMAYQNIQTWRRNQGKARQEERVREMFLNQGFAEVAPRRVGTLGNAPESGAFCKESVVGTRKADFVAGLWDQRKMLIECKVSNSELNSVKRLNNDAAAKAEAWLQDFGRSNVVPVAVLSGVYKVANLVEAQERGLALFWAHDLAALAAWISRTRGA